MGRLTNELIALLEVLMEYQDALNEKGYFLFKKCRMCEVVKPLSEYNNKSKNSDGKQSYCKVCQGEHNREYLRRAQETQLTPAPEPEPQAKTGREKVDELKNKIRMMLGE